MFKILNRIIGRDSTKCVGYTVENLDNGIIGSVSKDMVNALVICSLVQDITMDNKGKLAGLNGFKISSIKNRTIQLDEEKHFKDMEYFKGVENQTELYVEDKKVVVEYFENDPDFNAFDENSECVEYEDTVEDTAGSIESNTLRKPYSVANRGRFRESEKPIKITRGTQKGYQNVEIRSVGFDKKTGYSYVIARTNKKLFDKEFKNFCIKSKVEENYVTFSTYLKNFEYRLCEVNLEKHQIIATKRTLVFIKKCMLEAKERRVSGVDLFNLVNPRTYGDLLDFYLYLCKNAIYIEDEEVKWVN